MDAFEILKESIKRVPILKYALGVAGIVAAVALIKIFGVENYKIPIITILVIIGFMVLLFVFSSVTKSKDPKIKYAGYIMIYTTIIAFSFSSLLLLLSVFFNYPKPISSYFNSTSSDTTSNQTVLQKNIFFKNVDSILYKVKFNSSIEDVLYYEFGKSYPNFYDSLPTADECKENVVKYYWRNMKESPLGQGVLNYFENKGMKNYINDNSFVVYSFKDKRLVKIDLRIFSSVNNFYEEFIKVLGLNSTDFPSKYISKHNDYYYIAGNTRAETSFHLVICNYEGYTLCSTDWWNN